MQKLKSGSVTHTLFTGELYKLEWYDTASTLKKKNAFKATLVFRKCKVNNHKERTSVYSHIESNDRTEISNFCFISSKRPFS